MGLKETWAVIKEELMSASEADLNFQVEKQRKSGVTGLDQCNDPDMKDFKRKQVDDLIQDCVTMELVHRFEQHCLY